MLLVVFLDSYSFLRVSKQVLISSAQILFICTKEPTLSGNNYISI